MVDGWWLLWSCKERYKSFSGFVGELWDKTYLCIVHIFVFPFARRVITRALPFSEITPYIHTFFLSFFDRAWERDNCGTIPYTITPLRKLPPCKWGVGSILINTFIKPVWRISPRHFFVTRDIPRVQCFHSKVLNHFWNALSLLECERRGEREKRGTCRDCSISIDFFHLLVWTRGLVLGPRSWYLVMCVLYICSIGCSIINPSVFWH